MTSRPVHRAWTLRCRRAVERCARLFAVPAENPELIRSQSAALSTQIPLLYFILVTNSVALALTHLHSAPAWMTVWTPGALCGFCIVRLVWWRRIRHIEVDTATHLRRLRLTLRLVPVLGVLFTAWGFNLYRYGDAYAQAHVAFYMAITVIGCIFCLMHLRGAALMLAAIVILPFAVFFSLTGNLVFMLMAANLLLVWVAMIFVLLVHYRDFARLVESTVTLRLRQAETQRLSDENFRLANLDSLTGLPNRRAFLAHVDSMAAHASGHHAARARGTRSIVIGLIDLDDFKLVNDAYGHSTGDRVLAEVGRRLLDISTNPVFFARLGGDEFGMLLRENLSTDELMARGRALCRLLQQPYELGELTLRLTASVGFAASPDGPLERPELLFEQADHALYYAKQNARGEPVIFSHAHESERRRMGLIEQALAHADLVRELSVAFQPIVELPSHRILGFEALARWTHERLGQVPPAEFIACAERSNRILQVSEVLLKKALAEARRWPDDTWVSFNLSARDIGSPEATQRIADIVLASGVPPHRIEMEITETALVSDFDVASESLRLLKELGVRIALDDFGTGFSSLTYVQRLPLDKIKIDRSFVSDIVHNATGQSVVKSIVDLCRNLDLDCVVEGAEDEEQVGILHELGCRKMQGYLFGRPMAGDAACALLSRETTIQAA
ncbi:putative bifunctional diguanylate cyclase/phosphodiesterase [Paraburkholderia kururiensis]|uniref:EAL domain-containing protein n=1 Tax=Paraburkholderia kururiensis TaxID=984307 RepID=A0ABZ0WL67_9BURK|nr:EAL domain-containing protein [Paraburkholderia kururiensis]WQD78103.1 EAL domain-containing protein [Paraburkholderia kururiensis]